MSLRELLEVVEAAGYTCRRVVDKDNGDPYTLMLIRHDGKNEVKTLKERLTSLGVRHSFGHWHTEYAPEIGGPCVFLA
jgi:hypothetical protein